MAPSERDVRDFEHAKELARSGRARQAIDRYEELLTRMGQQPAVLAMLAASLMDVGRAEDARRRLKTAVRRAPRNADLQRRLADAARLAGRVDEAHRAIDESLELEPGSQLSIASKAHLFLAAGRIADAAELFERALAEVGQGPIEPMFALTFARLAPDRVTTDEAIAIIRRAEVHRAVSQSVQSELLMRLGQLQDLSGLTEQAFQTYARANELAPGRFDPAVHAEAIDAVIAGWTPESVRIASHSRVVSERPVFIVGMPRSGTTLVERILGAHSRIAAGGERSDVIRFVAEHAPSRLGTVPMVADPATLSESELDRAALDALDSFGRLGGAIKRTTDKMPLNALHLGVISLLFPKARIIYCTRDPRDTCLSCYANWFNGYHAFTKDLAHLAAFHKNLDRLMTHWRELLELPILEVNYETLIQDAEGAARGMIEFLGLEFDEACLRHHEGGLILTNSVDQARKPIYSSSAGRWRRYEQHIEPLVRAFS